MSWVDENGREFFDLTDPADMERFDEILDELERQQAEADDATETADQ